MRLAWFRPTPPERSNLLDDTASLIAALRTSHAIDIFGAARAHDFVWTHAREPYDLCVYEIDNTPAHQFMWPYLLHYSGVLALRTTSLHDSRVAALAREQRYDDYREEMVFSGSPRPKVVPRRRVPRGSWPMLRAPLLASRVIVVSDTALATALTRDYTGARIRYAPIGVAAPASVLVDAAMPPPALKLGVLGMKHTAVLNGALRRAQAMGARIELLVEADVEHLLREAAAILALHWPSFGEPPTAALLGMAAAKPVVVSETFATAGWPAFDPQTWRPRAIESNETPIVVSIDPRDEEHSLMLAMKRLASDAGLRDQLGRAGHSWWRSHATVDHAAAAWHEILNEAATLALPPRPDDWPRHLTADGSELVRKILGHHGTHVDFLR